MQWIEEVAVSSCGVCGRGHNDDTDDQMLVQVLSQTSTGEKIELLAIYHWPSGIEQVYG
jgi:hypothetical protein